MSVVALVIAPSISLDSKKISDNFSSEEKLIKNQINLEDFNCNDFVLNEDLEMKYYYLEENYRFKA